MDYILDKQETLALVNLLAECENTDPKTKDILIESKSYLLDSIKEKYKLVIKNGFLLEADQAQVNKGILGRISSFIMGSIKKLGSAIGSILKALWRLVRSIWPLIVVGGLAYMTKRGADLLQLTKGGVGLGGAFRQFVGVAGTQNKTDASIGNKVITFAKNVSNFVYQSILRYVEVVSGKKQNIAYRDKRSEQLRAAQQKPITTQQPTESLKIDRIGNVLKSIGAFFVSIKNAFTSKPEAVVDPSFLNSIGPKMVTIPAESIGSKVPGSLGPQSNIQQRPEEQKEYVQSQAKKHYDKETSKTILDRAGEHLKLIGSKIGVSLGNMHKSLSNSVIKYVEQRSETPVSDEVKQEVETISNELSSPIKTEAEPKMEPKGTIDKFPIEGE